MAIKLRGWQLLEADRLMLLVALGLAVVLIISQVLGMQQRHRDSVRKADLYSLQLAVQKYFALNGFYPTSLNNLPGATNQACSDPKVGGSCSQPGYSYMALAQDGKSTCDNHSVICRNYQLAARHMETGAPIVLTSL